jgi:hypothetical protein
MTEDFEEQDQGNRFRAWGFVVGRFELKMLLVNGDVGYQIPFAFCLLADN